MQILDAIRHGRIQEVAEHPSNTALIFCSRFSRPFRYCIDSQADFIDKLGETWKNSWNVVAYRFWPNISAFIWQMVYCLSVTQRNHFDDKAFMDALLQFYSDAAVILSSEWALPPASLGRDFFSSDYITPAVIAFWVWCCQPEELRHELFMTITPSCVYTLQAVYGGKRYTRSPLRNHMASFLADRSLTSTITFAIQNFRHEYGTIFIHLMEFYLYDIELLIILSKSGFMHRFCLLFDKVIMSTASFLRGAASKYSVKQKEDLDVLKKFAAVGCRMLTHVDGPIMVLHSKGLLLSCIFKLLKLQARHRLRTPYQPLEDECVKLVQHMTSLTCYYTVQRSIRSCIERYNRSLERLFIDSSSSDAESWLWISWRKFYTVVMQSGRGLQVYMKRDPRYMCSAKEVRRVIEELKLI
jgi:hypothetical protein